MDFSSERSRSLNVQHRLAFADRWALPPEELEAQDKINGTVRVTL